MKCKISLKEIECLKLKERYSAIEVAKKIKLPVKMNRYEYIDLELTPYLIRPIELFGDSRVLWVFAIAPTQSGKTLLIQIFFADRIDQEEGTMIFVMPDKESSNKQFEEKLLKFIEENEFLDKHVLSPRKDCLSMSSIKMDNCSIYPGFSSNPASMNSLTCNAIGLDEVRLHKLKVKDGSNSIEYCEDRTSSYRTSGRTQHIGVTSPEIEGDLMHIQLSKDKTIEMWWMIPCPSASCDRLQILDIYKNFDLMSDGVNYTSTCRCKYCGQEFSDKFDKKPMNATGIYCKKEKEGIKKKDYLLTGEADLVDKHMIFRWTSEVSPFRTFKEIAEKYNKVREDPSALNNFNQAWRARFTSKRKSQITLKKLSDRISPSLPRACVPNWTRVITAGADSQGNGFAYWVHAYGDEGRSACIDAGFLKSHYLDSVKSVSDVLSKAFEHKVYYSMKKEKWAIGLWAIDTGGNRTQQVYDSLSGFLKCVPCKGVHNSDVNIRFAKTANIDNLYLIKTLTYFNITDETCLSPNWYLYNNIDRKVLQEFCNLRKVAGDKENKYGEVEEYFKKFGKCDWRIAAAHCEICLDMKFENGMRLREELNTPDFVYNPVYNIIGLSQEMDYDESEDLNTKDLNTQYSKDSKDSKDLNPLNPRDSKYSKYSNENRFTESGLII